MRRPNPGSGLGLFQALLHAEWKALPQLRETQSVRELGPGPRSTTWSTIYNMIHDLGPGLLAWSLFMS